MGNGMMPMQNMQNGQMQHMMNQGMMPMNMMQPMMNQFQGYQQQPPMMDSNPQYMQMKMGMLPMQQPNGQAQNQMPVPS